MGGLNQQLKVTSVLIVEDHADAARVLEQVVSDTFAIPEVVVVSNLAAAMQQIVAKSFSLALIDIGLPDGSGIDLVRFITSEKLSTLSLVTTIFADDKHLFEALRAGACGYLLKGYSPVQLQQYLLDAMSGKPALSPGIAQSMLSYFRNAETADQLKLDLEGLTERELEILRLIAKGEKVKAVGEFLGISKNTVSQHVKSLYRKLNVHNRAQATAAALNLDVFQPL